MSQPISSQTLHLASAVAKLLEENQDAVFQTGKYANVYVGSVELRWYSPGDGIGETVGYLRPDEFDGGTYELYLPTKEETV